jgi:hypothetical protein
MIRVEVDGIGEVAVPWTARMTQTAAQKVQDLIDSLPEEEVEQ